MQNLDRYACAVPSAAQPWLESLPWEQRRFVLSLCRITCVSAASASRAAVAGSLQADPLYAELLEHLLADQGCRQRVDGHLKRFHIPLTLSEPLLEGYLHQLYAHLAQDSQPPPYLCLEAALHLLTSDEERSSIFHYVLGFELLKLMFQLSWSQHERLYRLQVSQEEFIRAYIKPIQRAHRHNRIIRPKDEGQFFARRDYFVQPPNLTSDRLTNLVMTTFTVASAVNLGLSLICHPSSFQFDHAAVFAAEPEEAIFNQVV